MAKHQKKGCGGDDPKQKQSATENKIPILGKRSEKKQCRKQSNTIPSGSEEINNWVSKMKEKQNEKEIKKSKEEN